MADTSQAAQGATGLTCPKCAGQMRTYERNGITIDRCRRRRAGFLGGLLDFG